MTKAEVLALIDVKIAEAANPMNEVRAAVDSIEVGDGGLSQRVAELEAQIADLSSRLSAAEGKIDQIRAILA